MHPQQKLVLRVAGDQLVAAEAASSTQLDFEFDGVVYICIHSLHAGH